MGCLGENTLRRWSVADQSSPVERSINDVAGADFDAKKCFVCIGNGPSGDFLLSGIT